MHRKNTLPQMLQWHPAFFAGLQIELQEDSENLIFENEHQLGMKPKEIDVLINHLLLNGKYSMIKPHQGIYYIQGFLFPVQVVLTEELSEQESLWLRSLANDLNGRETIEMLLQDYGRHKDNKLYQAVMGMIVRANRQTFQEIKDDRHIQNG